MDTYFNTYFEPDENMPKKPEPAPPLPDMPSGARRPTSAPPPHKTVPTRNHFEKSLYDSPFVDLDEFADLLLSDAGRNQLIRQAQRTSPLVANAYRGIEPLGLSGNEQHAAVLIMLVKFLTPGAS